ncbi:MAG: WD40/YVTN/BNR-like repeat-containing protein, partial [Blastocatellia bacterium]
MQYLLNRWKNNTRSLGFIALAVCLLIAGAAALSRVSASMSEGKGKKAEGREEKKVTDWIERTRRVRRQMHGEPAPDAKNRAEQTTRATDSVEHLDDSPSPFDFSPARLFKEIFGEPFDKPREATEHFVRKRLPEGEKELPLEKYFEAQEQMRGMRYFSTALDRIVTKGENLTASLSAAEMAPNAATWTPLGPGNIGGRTRALLINPQDANLMYAAGVSGGVWKTTNGGQSWAPISDLIGNINVSSMVMEPGNPNVVYVGSGEGVIVAEVDTIGDFRGAGIFKTTDGGANWTRLEGTRNE